MAHSLPTRPEVVRWRSTTNFLLLAEQAVTAVAEERCDRRQDDWIGRKRDVTTEYLESCCSLQKPEPMRNDAITLGYVRDQWSVDRRNERAGDIEQAISARHTV